MQAFLKEVATPPKRPPDEAYAAMLAKRAEIQQAGRVHFEAQRIAALALPAVAALPPPFG